LRKLFFIIPLLISLSAQAAPERLGLREAIDRAMQGNRDLKAQRVQETQAEEEIRRVRGEFGLHLEGLLGIGPITKANGDATRVVEDHDTWGRTLVGKASATYPLYTWGREGDYEKAAKAGVHVKQAESGLKENELRYDVKESFYGYQLANSLKDFIAGGKADLEKALEKRKQKLKPGAKEDYKLEIFLHEVESREAEVNKYFDLAKDGFALRLGAERGSVLPKDDWLLPEQRAHQSAEQYVSMALASRPEFRQLAEGIYAKRSLARAELKGLYPMLGLMASYEAADTNVRNPQPGVFSYDPYNHKTTTGGIGFKWDFQWELQDAKAAKLRAEAEELEAKEAYAKQGIETEVRKAYYEVVEAETRLKAATEAYKTGKKWLTGEAIGFGSGLGNSQALVDAYEARAMTAKAYFEAVYRHHLAWATLSKVVGAEVDPLLAGRP
jgi:outer membrane protein, multidrug efflux system